MADDQIFMKYEGGDADRHSVEMRALGNSMIGLERIISDGLIFFGHGRLPRRGERHELVVRAKEPVTGSSIIPVSLDVATGLLPLGWWLLQTGAGHVITTWMSLVFSKLSGQAGGVQMALESLVKMREIEARERLAAQKMWLASEEHSRELMLRLVDRLSPAAIRAVSPIGPSVDQLTFNAPGSTSTTVDLPAADAIRSKGELVISDLQSLVVKVDGFVHHSKKLNIENPESPGSFISADVRDPSFDDPPNIYTEAAAARTSIQVQAKLGRRNHVLERIYIMHGQKAPPS